MVIATTHDDPGTASRAGLAADKGRMADAKWKGTRMTLSMKIGLIAVLAIALTSGSGHTQSTATQDPSTQSSDTTSADPDTSDSADTGPAPAVDPALSQVSADGTPYQYGVFREVVGEATPAGQRNCWVQGLVNGQTINGDLMTERVLLTQAQCVLRYLTRRGLCANQRTTSYWSARKDDASNGASNNPSNSWRSNNWQNNNASQGGGDAQGSGSSQGGGSTQGGVWGHRDQRWQNAGEPGNGGDPRNSGQWTRQGEWIRSGGVDPAWINTICGANGTASGSGAGTGPGTGTTTAGN